MASKATAAKPKAKAVERAARFRAGTVALVGQPNVGKSTLLNVIIGERLAITSHHPQTTRDRIAGILTTPKAQFVFLDTPGLHSAKNRLGHRMNDVASGAALEADVVVFVAAIGGGSKSRVVAGAEGSTRELDASKKGFGSVAAPVAPKVTVVEVDKRDREILEKLPEATPVILVVNKVDRLRDKAELFDLLAAYGALRDFAAVVPLSAKEEARRIKNRRKEDGISRLLAEIEGRLPEGDLLFPDDELSDRPVRFFVAEIVREQALLRTREEVPHGVAVTVDAFEEGKKLTRVTLTMHVAKESHKGILIGQGGQMLAAIGTAARERVERLLGQKVHLDIRVKATPGWFDDAAHLSSLGYADDSGSKKNKPKKKPEAAGTRRGSST